MKFISYNEEIKQITAQLTDVFNNIQIRRIGIVNEQYVTKTILVPCVAGHRSRILKSLENRNKTLKLPMTALSVKSFNVDKSRIHSSNDMLLYQTTNTSLLHNTAIPIEIDYQFDIITKYMSDMDQIWSTITAVMTPDFYIVIDFPFHNKKLKIQIIKENDLSLKTPEDSTKNAYRFTGTINLKARAWQFPGNKAYSLGNEPIILKINNKYEPEQHTVSEYLSRWYDVKNESIDSYIKAVTSGLIEYPYYDEIELVNEPSGSAEDNRTSNDTMPQIMPRNIMKFISYNEEIKEVTAQLLDVFNNIEIKRLGIVNNQYVTKTILVPCVAGHRSRVLKSLENRDKTLKLPIISLSINNIKVDNSRSHSVNDLLLYGTSSINLLHNTAVPIEIAFSLNVITKYMNDIDQIWSTITAVMTPDFYVVVNFPFYNKKLKIQIIKDHNFAIEIPVENKNKPYRFVSAINLRARAWLFPGNKEYSLGNEPVIKHINVRKLYGSGSSDDGDTISDFFSRWYDVRNGSIDDYIEAIASGLIQYPNYDEFEMIDTISGGYWLNNVYGLMSGNIYNFNLTGDLSSLIQNENNDDLIVTTFRDDGSFYTPEYFEDIDWGSLWRRMLSGDLYDADYRYVKYYGNNNTSGTAPLRQVVSINTPITINGNTGNLIRTGYTFNNWNTQADELGIDYNVGDLYNDSTNLELYAKWAEQLGCPNSPRYPVKVYRSGGINYATSGTRKYHSIEVVAYDADNELVFSAHNAIRIEPYEGPSSPFTYSGCDLVYIDEFASAASSDITVTYGEASITINTINDLRCGTVCVGGPSIDPFDNWCNCDGTYGANYTVYYNGNDSVSGSVPESQTAYYNTNISLRYNTGLLTKTNYQFTGWNTQTDGLGTHYDEGDTYTIPVVDITLYAEWTVLNFSVNYDGNSNTSGTVPASQSGDYNTSITLQSNSGVLTKTGYTFVGWNTQADGLGTNYAEGASFTIPASTTTLYAKWVVNNYSVAYDGNSSTSGTVPASQSGDYNTSITLQSNSGVLAKTGYTFVGWNTQSDGLGTNYLEGASFTVPSSTTTLYAKWVVNNYSVAYDGNGNTGGAIPTSQSGDYGTSITLQSNSGVLVKTGYTFVGWNTQANGLGTNYAQGASFTIPASATTLYAKWAIEYTITYNGNSNTSGSVPSSQTGYYQDSITLRSNTGTLVRTGYTFAGWNTASNGLGTDYAEGASFSMPAANTTLYAKWAINSYNVTYDGNSNTSGSVPTSQSGNYNSSITLRTNTGTLQRQSYNTLAGWNTASDGSGTNYSLGASFTIPAGNTTLYAKWTACHSCNPVKPATVTATLSAPIKISTCNNTNYTFSGSYVLSLCTRTGEPCAYLLTNFGFGNPNIYLWYYPGSGRYQLSLYANDSYDCYADNNAATGSTDACNPAGTYTIAYQGAGCGPCSRDTNITVVIS